MNSFFKDAHRYIRYFVRKLSASRVGAYAAQTAFFMFLSLIPLIMLLLSLLRQIDAEALTDINITQYTPNIVDAFLNTYLSEITSDSKMSLTIVSSLVLLWSASKGVFAVIGGLNSVYEIKESRRYFFLRFLAILYTVAFILILLIVLAIMVFGDKLNEFLMSLLPDLKELVFILSSLRFIIIFALLFLFFTALYKALPSNRMKFSEQIPGAVIASAGWIIFSMIFSFFVENFSQYATVYGSLSAIIVLLVWMYMCMYILFIGAELNLILSKKTI